MAKKSSDRRGVTLMVTLQQYLSRLEMLEAARPDGSERRKVPSLPELAEAAGISRQAMYNIASHEVRRVNLDILGSVLGELRLRGFEVSISDLLGEVPREFAGSQRRAS